MINSIPKSTNGTPNPNIVSKLSKQFWLWAKAIFNYWRRKLCQQLQFNRCQKITSIEKSNSKYLENLRIQNLFHFSRKMHQGSNILRKLVRCSFQKMGPGLWIWGCWGWMMFMVENWVWPQKFSPTLKSLLPTSKMYSRQYEEQFQSSDFLLC